MKNGKHTSKFSDVMILSVHYINLGALYSRPVAHIVYYHTAAIIDADGATTNVFTTTTTTTTTCATTSTTTVYHPEHC